MPSAAPLLLLLSGVSFIVVKVVNFFRRLFSLPPLATNGMPYACIPSRNIDALSFVMARLMRPGFLVATEQLAKVTSNNFQTVRGCFSLSVGQ